MEICIKIPVPTKYFSLYVQGRVLDVASMGNGESSFVTMDSDWPMALYYRVMNRRHIFICTQSSICGFATRIFPEAMIPLTVLTELDGRAYDRYKRTMRMLEDKTKGDCFMSPPDFFIRLAELCRCGRNSMSNVMLLYSLKGGDHAKK